MRSNFSVFLKSFYLSMVLILCFSFAFIGVSRSYEAMTYTLSGEKKSAIEILDNGIRILDFYVNFKIF